MDATVRFEIEDSIAVVVIANPPVNALSHAVRLGLQTVLKEVAAQSEVKAIVICCDGRTFIAGADIKEFGKPPKEPFLPDLINDIEAITKPVIVSMHGTTLGGGLEIALGAHYRVALASSKMGLPEVSLGLLPGAGGTQRLPRLIGAQHALEMITTGTPIGTSEALEFGLIDKIDGGLDARKAGVIFAKQIIDAGNPVRPTCEMAVAAAPDVFETARTKLAKSARGQLAPQRCVDAVEGATKLPFDDGLRQERAFFTELMKSDQRASMIHAFFSERQVAKLPEIVEVPPREVAAVGVVGGGTMGAGIATSALLAGLSVTLLERNEEAAQKALATVSNLLGGSVKRGKLTEEQYDAILNGIFSATTDYGRFSDVDVVIEAVFESLEVKKDVFSKLDAVCKPGAILASNTSYLDLNVIAAMTKRPEDVIGLHFFSPAHVMKLLEIVVADQTSPEVTATGFALAKKMRKVAVRSGVCDGFIGNRIMAQYRKAADGAVLAGASPFDVDRALVGFGLAMGPYAVGDLAGLDIGWASRKRLAPTRDPRERYATFSDKLCEQGHFGRKTGTGFYLYHDGASQPNPAVYELIEADRLELRITASDLSDQDIVDRYMAAMVNEAARVIEEGIALRPLDVDVTLLNGYGFPRWRGGPMQYADTVGLDKILTDIEKFSAEDDFLWQPAELLKRLASEGKSFASLN